MLLPAMAGGGPQNVLVVVNQLSPRSMELGHYYAEKRGIPERNLCPVRIDPDSQNATWEEFSTQVVDVIERHVNARDLQGQIDYLVLSMDLPSRVNDNEGATAVLFYGFKGAPRINPPALPCSAPPDTRSSFLGKERAYRRGAFPGLEPGYLAMMLTASDLDEAKRLVDRSVAADGSHPAGTFYLLKPPGDPARNIRGMLFDNFEFHAKLWPGFPRYERLHQNEIQNKRDVMGWLTGLPGYPDWVWTNNVLLPGALGDHLTSFAGRLPEPPLGQDSILKWIRAGASATYGTVAEPCSMLAKFPDPLVFYWYGRGFNAAESYAMSLAHPYQGLLVGDPLTAPYATPPRVTVSGLAPDSEVSGVVTLQVEAAATSSEGCCSRLDLFVDGLLYTNLVRLSPAPWNTLEAVVEGRKHLYTVGRNDSLFTAVEGLARSISQHDPFLKGIPIGDRVMLLDSRVGLDPFSVKCEAAAGKGIGRELTVTGRAMTSTLVNPGVDAIRPFELKGRAETGDRILCTFVLTNSATVTKDLAVNHGEKAPDVMLQLWKAINEDERLMQPDGIWLTEVARFENHATASWRARQPGPAGVGIEVEFRVIPARTGRGLDPSVSFKSKLVGNVAVMTGRANLLFACGRNPLVAGYELDTTALPDGSHVLMAVAEDGSAVATQGRTEVPFEVRNTRLTCEIEEPADGLRVPLREQVRVTAAAESGESRVEEVEFYVEGKLLRVVSKPPFRAEWKAGDYGPGRVSVQAKATDAAGRQVISAPVWVEIIP